MTFNPKSLENLTHFQPGNPGGGRKKGSITFASVIKRALKQQMVHIDPITQQKESKKLREWVVLSLISKAINGDISAIKELLERIDGKVAQVNQHTGKDGGPIETRNEVVTDDAVNERINDLLGKNKE